MNRFSTISTFCIATVLAALCPSLISEPGYTLDSSSLKDSLSYGVAPVRAPHPARKKYASDEVTFTTIEQGAVSGISTNERLSIKDEMTWIEVWKKHSEGKRVPQMLPHVDFDRNMVLAVFDGEKSGGGELVRIECVRLLKDKMVVLLGHDRIGSGSTGSTRSTLRSFHIVSLPKTSLPVVFH